MRLLKQVQDYTWDMFLMTGLRQQGKGIAWTHMPLNLFQLNKVNTIMENMKKLNITLLSLLLLYGCASGQESGSSQAFARLPQPKQGEKVATFAGGCFWSLSESLSELNGVNKVVAGYSGGTVKNPTYEDVCTKLTGHAESV